MSQKQLLIASIQGPKGEDAQELVKQTTKQLYGVRPMFLLVIAFQKLSQMLNFELVGIAHKNQAKFRWNDHSRLLFNYDEFWKENQATFTQQGYWQLPLTTVRKDLSDIASKKRAMYRKRYEMLDSLFEQMAQTLDSDTQK